jgi:hypothetical protein
MLTVDEIEDSFEVHFRQQVEDLPDETLHAILNDMHVLRRYAPPSLAASQARDIVSEILRLRQPAPPEPEPEPVIEQPAPEPEPLPLPVSRIEPYLEPEIPHDEHPAAEHCLEPELRFEALPEQEAEPDDGADEPSYDAQTTLTALPPRLRGRWVVAALVILGAVIAIALLS